MQGGRNGDTTISLEGWGIGFQAAKSPAGVCRAGLDVALLESEEKLSIYIQKEASSDHEATPLHVETLEIG